jgi:hypothetical protein
MNPTDVARKEYVKRLKEIYKRKNGEELSDEQALQIFEQLISLVRAVYQPMSVNNYQNGDQKMKSKDT